MKPVRIELDIKEFVLTGVSTIDRSRLIESMAAELTRLTSMTGFPKTAAGPGHIELLKGDSLRLEPHSHIGDIGIHLARTIYRGLSNQNAPDNMESVDKDTFTQ